MTENPKPLFIELRELITAAEAGAQIDVGPLRARLADEVDQNEQLVKAVDELEGDAKGDMRDQIVYLLGLFGIYEDAVDALERGDVGGAKRSLSQVNTASFVRAVQDDPDRLIETLRPGMRS